MNVVSLIDRTAGAHGGSEANTGLLMMAAKMAQIGGWEADLASGMLTLSDEACRICELPVGSVISLEEARLYCAPEWRDEMVTRVKTCAREARPFDQKLQLRTVRGKARVVRVAGEAVRDDAGKIVRLQGAVRDVSARQRAQDALRQSHERLRFTLEASGMAAWEMDLDTGLAYRTVEHDQIFGDSKLSREWNYRSFLEYVHPDDRAEVDAKCRHMVKAGEDWDFECRIIRTNGAIRWIWVTARRLRDFSGLRDFGAESDRIVGLVQDATERRKLQQRLKDETRRARAQLSFPHVAETMTEDAFIRHGLALVEDLTQSRLTFLHFVDEDRGTMQLANWSRRTGEECGLGAGERFYRVDEAGIWAEVLRSRKPVRCNDYQATYEECDSLAGHSLMTRCVVSPVIDSGRVVMMLAVGSKTAEYTDFDVETVQLIAEQLWSIVQKRRTENRLRQRSQVIEQSPQAVLITDRDGHIEYVNDAFQRISGYAFEEVRGMNPRFLQSGKTPRVVYEQLWDALTRGKAWRGEFVNRRKDGTEYVEFGHVAPLCQDDGTVTHYVLAGEDITEKKHLGEELDRYRHRLEELVEQRTAQLEQALVSAESASRCKGAFLANMSHEIRTPLNAIVGLVYILANEKAATAEQKYRLHKIETAASHLLSVINDILDISKIEAGKLLLDNKDFHLSSVVDHVCAMIADDAAERGLVLEKDSGSAPLRLHGDAPRLRQALLNLAANAVKFTEAGTVTVRVKLLQQDPETRQVCLRFEVEDTGKGISPEQRERLFEAFEQGDSSVTREYGGTGLGLMITRRIAESMGGSAGAHSELGRGSLFWFEVWLSPSRAEQDILVSSSMLTPKREVFCRFAGTPVLLVEDNDSNMEVALTLLQSVGLQVDCAKHGAEAVAKLTQRGYGLVLMDIQMPVMDGLTATQQIRQLPRGRDLPILAMTANVSAEDRSQAREAGMNDFIPKPMAADMLYETLLRWLSTTAGR